MQGVRSAWADTLQFYQVERSFCDGDGVYKKRHPPDMGVWKWQKSGVHPQTCYTMVHNATQCYALVRNAHLLESTPHIWTLRFCYGLGVGRLKVYRFERLVGGIRGRGRRGGSGRRRRLFGGRGCRSWLFSRPCARGVPGQCGCRSLSAGAGWQNCA